MATKLESNKGIEMLNYIDDKINNNEIEVASILLSHFAYEENLINYTNYLKGLCSVKSSNPDYKQALEYFNKISPINDLVQMMILNCKYYLEQYEDIIKFHMNNLNLKLLKSEEYLMLVAVSHEKINLIKSSLAIYKEIIDLNPLNFTAVNNFLVLCLRTNNISNFTKELLDHCILNLKSLCPELLNNLGVYMIHIGQKNEGVRLLAGLTEMGCVSNYINELIALDRTKEAEELLEKTFLKDDSGIQALMYGTLLLEANNIKKAKEIYTAYSEGHDLNSKKSKHYEIILANLKSIQSLQLNSPIKENKQDYKLKIDKEDNNDFINIQNNQYEGLNNSREVENKVNINSDFTVITEDRSNQTSDHSNSIIRHKRSFDRYLESIYSNAMSRVYLELEDRQRQENILDKIKDVFEKEKKNPDSGFTSTRQLFSSTKESLSCKHFLIQVEVIFSYIALTDQKYWLIIESLSPYLAELNYNNMYLLKRAYIELKDYEPLIAIYNQKIKDGCDERYVFDLLDVFDAANDSEKFRRHAKLIYLEQGGKVNRELLERVILKVLKSASADITNCYDELADDYQSSSVPNTKLSKTEINKFIYFSGVYNLKKKIYNVAFESFIKLEEDEEYCNNPDFLKHYAKTCVKLKNNKKAIKYYKRALELDNLDFDSSLGIGECYLNMDVFDRTEKYLNHCLRLECSNEKRALMYFAFGRLFYKQKENNKAIEQFKKCLDYDPFSFRSYHNIALIHISLNNYDKAKQYLENCIKINPEYYIAQYELLSIEATTSTNKKPELQIKFEKIMEYLPQMTLDYTKLLFEYFEDFKSGINYLKKYIALKEINGSKVFEMIELLIKKDYHEESLAIFNEILKKTDKNYLIYKRICNLFLKKKNFEYALNVIQLCAKDNPHNFSVMSKYAYCLMKKEQYEEAIKIFNTTEELYTNEITYNGFLKNLCFCLCETSAFEQAKIEMVKHHSKLSEQGNNLILAVICARLDAEDQAMNYLMIEKKMFPTNEKAMIDYPKLKEISFNEIF